MTAPSDWSAAIVEAAPTAMLMLDRDRRIALINRGAEALFGYARAELLGQSVDALVPARFRARHGALVERFVANPQARPMGAARELLGLRKDGTEVPVEIGLTPIELPSGMFTLATVIDVSERHRAQERLGIVFEAAPNAMLVFDRGRRITLVNRAAEELFGYARADLLARPIDALVPDRFRADHPDRADAFAAPPLPPPLAGSRDLVGLRADGAEVPIEIALAAIDTPDGPCTLASITDLRERKTAEERLRRVIEAAPSAMLAIDRHQRIALVNRRTEEMFGYPRAALLGAPIERLVPARARASHAGHVERFFREPAARPMGAGPELFGRRADGTEIPVEIGLSPIDTADGPLTLASVIDITERKRAQVAHDRLAAIVESSEDAIMSATADGTLTSWNASAERLFGYRADEALGRSLLQLVPDRLVPAEQQLLAQVRADQRIAHLVTVRRRKDGSEFDVQVSVSPIHDAHDRVVGAAAIVRDITELKRRDTELLRSNAELEQFAYVASHDLQEPLRMVANYTELLAQRYQGKLDDKADKYIFYASDGARRMQRLVADLLTYSRVGSQAKPLELVAADQVVDRVRRLLGQALRECDAVVEHGELPVVMADETQLGQLFQNLIGNAVKFRSAAPPHVVITAAAEGGHWHFSVRDNGIGMDMRHADRIFQMFQRLHEIGKFEGSGIGLAIAKRIIERHGGRLWVESTPGVGSTFHFTLPAVTRGQP